MSLPDDELADDRARTATSSRYSQGPAAETKRAKPVSRVRYRALAWLTAAAGLAYLCRNAVGVAESQIREDLGLTLSQSGWFLGAFFWTYAVFQVPSGWLVERVGTRLSLGVFTLVGSAAMLATGLAPSFWLLLAAQLAMGVAQAGLIPATVGSVGSWMPLSQRSLACGILAAGMQIGAVSAGALAGVLLQSLEWRYVFATFALPGVLWTLGFWIWFRNAPEHVLPADSEELALIRSGRDFPCEPDTANEPTEVVELLKIARDPSMWWLCGQQVCRSAGYMFFASWFPTFLQKTRGVSVETSGYLQGIVLGGTLLGCILGGAFTDWVWRRTGSLRASRSGVGAASLGACSIVIAAAWWVESMEVAVLLLAVSAFCAAFAGPCAFATTIDIGGSRIPQVAGVMNMTGNIGAALLPNLVGKVFAATDNWNLVLLIISGIFLVGAICWVFVNPRQRIH